MSDLMINMTGVLPFWALPIMPVGLMINIAGVRPRGTARHVRLLAFLSASCMLFLLHAKGSSRLSYGRPFV